MLDRNYLVGKLQVLEEQFEKLKNNLTATSGGVQLIKHMLAELDGLEAKAKQIAETAEEKISKL